VKLRILDDSIRLRLSQSDVRQVEETGLVEGRTHFPGGAVFTYALQVLDPGPAAAAYSADRLVVSLPQTEIVQWANDDAAVSIQSEIELPDGDSLRLLVEKDFQCLTERPDEDQSDLFTNPQTGEC
jgi:hypothetical protein